MYPRTTRLIPPVLLLLPLAFTACQSHPTPPAASAPQATATTRYSARDLRDTGAESARPVTSRLFGHDDPAARRLFLVDASGSMTDNLDTLRIQLAHALGALDPQTAFALVAFADDEGRPLAPHWLLATPDAKSRAAAFLNRLDAHGPSDPAPALRRALVLRPESIYLLTDGDFPDARLFVRTVGRTLDLQPAALHVIALGGPEDNDPLLTDLATAHHGTFTRLRP